MASSTFDKSHDVKHANDNNHADSDDGLDVQGCKDLVKELKSDKSILKSHTTTSNSRSVGQIKQNKNCETKS